MPTLELAFCPTGPGGGVDPTCSPNTATGSSGWPDDVRKKLRALQSRLSRAKTVEAKAKTVLAINALIAEQNGVKATPAPTGKQSVKEALLAAAKSVPIKKLPQEGLMEFGEWNTWGFEAETGMYRFKTPSGRGFEIMLEDNHLLFTDEEQNDNVTGKGEAHFVFSEVSKAVVAVATRTKQDEIYFTADSESKGRGRLYSRLASGLAELVPNATVVKTPRDNGSIAFTVRLRKGKDVAFAFCPTGEGGGVDPTCSPDGAGGGGKSSGVRGVDTKETKELKEQAAAVKAWAAANKADGANARKYTGSLFSEINKALRNGEELSPKQQAVVESLDKLLDEFSAPTELVMTRAVGPNTQKKWVKGYVHTEDSYTSMSVNGLKLGKAATTVPWDRQTRAIITVPKGTKGAYVKEISSNKAEKEFIGARGLQFRVTKRQDNVSPDVAAKLLYGDAKTGKPFLRHPTYNIIHMTVETPRVEFAFCPTGPGGGVDPTCSPHGASAGGYSTLLAETGTPVLKKAIGTKNWPDEAKKKLRALQSKLSRAKTQAAKNVVIKAINAHIDAQNGVPAAPAMTVAALTNTPAPTPATISAGLAAYQASVAANAAAIAARDASIIKVDTIVTQPLMEEARAVAAWYAEANNNPNSPNKDAANSVRYYTGSGSAYINNALRGKTAMTETQAKMVANIDATMEKFKTPKDLVVTRAVGPKTQKNWVEGHVHHEKAYSSCSATAVRHAGYNAGWDKETRCVISVPKGTPGMYIPNISAYPKERELLLARNLKFKVTRREENVSKARMLKILYGDRAGVSTNDLRHPTYTLIHMEVLPPDNK